MCEGGLKEKYRQNEYLAKLLISTNGQILVEASRDHDWGCGISLNDDRVLYQNCWYSQGILGEMLQSIREELIKGDNTSSETDTIIPQDYDRMDTTHTSRAEET